MRPSRFGPLVRFVPVTIIASLLAAAAPRLAADDTPPAPLTGIGCLFSASNWCTEATWMTFLASTKL